MNHSGVVSTAAQSTNVALVPGGAGGHRRVDQRPNRRACRRRSTTRSSRLAVQNGPAAGGLAAVLEGRLRRRTRSKDAPAVHCPPGAPRPAQPEPHRERLATYAGTYDNSYYGPLVVRGPVAAKLTITASNPEGITRPRSRSPPFDGDTFTFETIGENANGAGPGRPHSRSEAAAATKGP